MTWSINNTNSSAECLYWNKTLLNWDTYGCYVVNKTTTSISCNCTHLTDFAARFTAVVESNQDIFTITAKSVYSTAGLKIYMNFYIIFGLFGALGLSTFIAGIYLDAQDSKQYHRNILLNPIIKKIATKYIVDVCHINHVEPLNIASKIEYAPPSLFYIVLNRILLQHSQISAFIRYDPRLSRIFRFLLIFVGLFNSLFLTAFMYGFTYGSNKTAVTSMSISDSLILSSVTAVLNYPSLIILSRLINSAGLAEFAWRYPVILDELTRRHRFENEISMCNEDELNLINKKDLVYTEPEAEKIIYDVSNIFNTIQIYFVGAVACIRKSQEAKNEEKNEEKNKAKKHENKKSNANGINKAYSYAKKPYINPIAKPLYYSYLPFHTYIGCAVFTISIGWFIWCLNYLLLFSANHDTGISNSILTSFGLNEFETILLIQPISILLTIALSYYFRKLTRGIYKPNKLHIPSLYYFSDPYVQSNSTQFSTHLAFEIFVNIPSQISRTFYKNTSIKEKNLGYAALPTVLDFIETGIDEYKPTPKEEKIENLYKSMNPLYLDLHSLKMREVQ
jgi:hypothetical protein